jgi:aminobenzoyl-glutamate utilization protein B
MTIARLLTVFVAATLAATNAFAQNGGGEALFPIRVHRSPLEVPRPSERAGNAAADATQLVGIKAEAVERVDTLRDLTQQINDMLFSFSELGFQEFETQRYLTEILRGNGFDVELGVAGIPSSWWATWGSGSPVIAIGSDVDGIPKASQLPGVAYRQPIVEGAPGHGEGHNSGQALNVTAALAVKSIMERDNLSGTLVLWPGIAEELLAAKAWYTRERLFDGVDAVLFTHVGDNLGVSWGPARGTGMISSEFTFSGVAAHGAGDPWRGRSALDAVEIMNVAWNYRREHLHPLQRSHYVVVDGGDQPNVVPSAATVWYFIREITADSIRENFETLQRIAEGAALMTDTSYTRRIIGAAWPRHFNEPIAQAVGRNIAAVGLPEWSESDQVYARALQSLLEVDEITGLATELDGVQGPPEEPVSGGSDDIGDISWVAPTITLRYPSNVEGLPGHHWSRAMAMATPIAHKGATAGAKVLAATLIDLLTDPLLVDEAWRYFREEQLVDTSYAPFIGPDDPPATDKNRETMAEFKSRLEPFYFNPSRFETYLEQLGVDYPQLVPDDQPIVPR